MRRRYLDITFLFSLCCSLVINSGMVGLVLLHTEATGAVHLSRLRTGRSSAPSAMASSASPTAEIVQPPQPQDQTVPPPPMKTLEFDPRDAFGEHNSPGEAINSVPGDLAMQAPKGSQVQAFLGRTPGEVGVTGNAANTIKSEQIASATGGAPLIGANPPTQAPRIIPHLPQPQQPPQSAKPQQPTPPAQPPARPPAQPPVQSPKQTPPSPATPPVALLPKPPQNIPRPQQPPKSQPPTAAPPTQSPPTQSPPVPAPAIPPVATADKPSAKPPQPGAQTDKTGGKDKSTNNSPAPDDLGQLPPPAQVAERILPPPSPQPAPPPQNPPQPTTPTLRPPQQPSPPTADSPPLSPPPDQNPAVASATSATPQAMQVAGRPGLKGLDPTPSPDITDKESDPFSDENSFAFRDGKVTARNGRWVKTVRPRFTQASVTDAFKIGAVAVTFLATVDEQGNVVRVVRYHTSGSDNIDLPCEEALNQWKIEPSKNKSGQYIKDVVAVTFGFE